MELLSKQDHVDAEIQGLKAIQRNIEVQNQKFLGFLALEIEIQSIIRTL